jgi:hypothetical protein
VTIPPATASKMKWLPVATIVKSMNGGYAAPMSRTHRRVASA